MAGVGTDGATLRYLDWGGGEVHGGEEDGGDDGERREEEDRCDDDGVCERWWA